MVNNSEKARFDFPVTNRWLYIVLGILIMLCLGTVYSFSVFRISIESHFQIGSTESGLPYMTALIFYALFMFLTGKHLEKFSPRAIICAGGFLVSLGWILSSFATSITFLTLTYGCISGAGVGIVYAAPMTVAAKWFPEKKGFAVGMVLVGFGLSPLITAPLARFLINAHGIMTTFLILGIGFGILIPILSYPFKYPKPGAYGRPGEHNEIEPIAVNISTKEMLSTRSFKGLYLNFIIGTMIGLMMIGLTANAGVEYIGSEPGRVAQLMAAFAVCNGLGRPLFGWITDKLTPPKAMVLSYALLIGSSTLLIAAGKNNEAVYVISFALYWLNLGGWLAIAPTSTLQLYGLKWYGRNYGLVFTAYGIGALTGVSTSGILLDMHGNYIYIFYFIIALCLVGIYITKKFFAEHGGKDVHI